jgi:hypothetical protein
MMFGTSIACASWRVLKRRLTPPINFRLPELLGRFYYTSYERFPIDTREEQRPRTYVAPPLEGPPLFCTRHTFKQLSTNDQV